MNKIPKVIHYCWFGGNPLPELAQKCIESWRKFCPDYEIVRWDESNFDISSNQYVKEAYEAKKWAFVTDYVRLHVIYEQGGVYFDTDVELLKNLDPILKYQGFMGFETGECINTGLGFGAVQNHPLVFEIMRDYDNVHFIKPDGSYDITPCPERNTKVLMKYGLIPNNAMQTIHEMVFMPTEYLSPKSYETGVIRITANSYAIHHYDASWMTKEQEMRARKRMKYTKIFGKKLGTYLIILEKSLKTHSFLGTMKKILLKIIRKMRS